MISPKKFLVEDFLSAETDSRALAAINDEALTGSELVDNLILLRLCEKPVVQKVLAEKYGMPFAWLNMDMTPPEFRAIADKHHVLIERGRILVVYVPLGQEVDDALLQIDIPSYEIHIRFIADCNYRLLQSHLPEDLLSFSVANFRPILVFKCLILDCINCAGTDLHIRSQYLKKKPYCNVKYRVKREMVDSKFKIDREMQQRLVQQVVGKLTPASTMDVDAIGGITTEIRDLFQDGSCDLRVTNMRVDAGYYMEIAIQLTNTTMLTLDELGFPKEDVTLLRELSKRRTGLTLVTGEMRSGKNTTIFAMLNEIKDDPIEIMEYSNPIENHMGHLQTNYRGDIDSLRNMIRLAKKQDIDIAVLNEIPNAEVAFAVRDLVNSAIGVITTTHLNRIWHLPNKLREFFGEDYKTIISQLNAVINHKIFRRWSSTVPMQKRALVKEQGPFEMFCYQSGVRQFFVPSDVKTVKYEVQPMVEILVLTDTIKTAMLNFDELWKAEQMLQLQMQQVHSKIENKVAVYVNEGIMSLEEMRHLY